MQAVLVRQYWQKQLRLELLAVSLDGTAVRTNYVNSVASTLIEGSIQGEARQRTQPWPWACARFLHMKPAGTPQGYRKCKGLFGIM